jgi:thiol-disulfide isomerase/thioredoxin
MTPFFSKAYIVGPAKEDDFFGEIHESKFLILQGEGGRQWLQSFYLDNSIAPMGNIKTVVPVGPSDKYLLLDSTLAFFHSWFASCKSMDEVISSLGKTDFLDINLNMPTRWQSLRNEAKDRFKELRILEAEFKPVKP